MNHFPIHRTRLFVVLTGAFLLALLMVGPSAIAGAQPDTFDCATQTEIPQVECEALVALYNSTDGDNWSNDDGWLVTNTPCGWAGVISGGGHVFDLNLSSNELNGSIPPDLGNCSNLESLDLSSNDLSSKIPPELGNLNNLTSLDLASNDLSGSIPPELGNLSNLTDIDDSIEKSLRR